MGCRRVATSCAFEHDEHPSASVDSPALRRFRGVRHGRSATVFRLRNQSQQCCRRGTRSEKMRSMDGPRLLRVMLPLRIHLRFAHRLPEGKAANNFGRHGNPRVRPVKTIRAPPQHSPSFGGRPHGRNSTPERSDGAMRRRGIAAPIASVHPEVLGKGARPARPQVLRLVIQPSRTVDLCVLPIGHPQLRDAPRSHPHRPFPFPFSPRVRMNPPHAPCGFWIARH